MSPTDLVVKARYSNADIAAMLREVHSCLHQGQEETRHIRHDLKNHRMEVQGSLEKLVSRVGKVEGRQAERSAQMDKMAEAMGRLEARLGTSDLEPGKMIKPAWFPKPWQLLTGIASIAVLYRLLVPVLEAFHTALLTVQI